MHQIRVILNLSAVFMGVSWNMKTSEKRIPIEHHCKFSLVMRETGIVHAAHKIQGGPETWLGVTPVAISRVEALTTHRIGLRLTSISEDFFFLKSEYSTYCQVYLLRRPKCPTIFFLRASTGINLLYRYNSFYYH